MNMKETFNMDSILTILSPNHSLTTKQDYIETSAALERYLVDTYEQDEYAQRKWNYYEERRSLIVASLYNQILRQNRLPTVAEFVETYLEENSHLIDQQAERFFANLGYLSLVSDLHFYFVLQASELFDRVVIDYEYDLTAYTDIFLTIGNQTLGLQLFAGSEQSQLGKEHQLKLDRAVRSYPIYLFSRKSPNGARKSIKTKSGKIVELYSYKDAIYWADFLKEQNAKTMEQYSEEILNEQCDIYSYAQSIEKSQSMSIDIQLDDETHSLLQHAKHSIFIIGEAAVSHLFPKIKEAAKAQGISIYPFDIPEVAVPNFFKNKRVIIDGLIKNQPIKASMYKLLHPLFEQSTCNIFQYEAEHFYASNDIIVAAGAGSGKTHTLVSRALYLVNTGKVSSLKEIAMITFTNETADRMREKLAERFLELLKDTGDLKYLTYLEDLQEMQISTIPSFAKRILTQFGQFIGLGTEMKISNFTMQRREIIENQLDIHVQHDFSIENLGKLPHYSLLQFIEQIWEKVEQKGLSPADFTSVDEQKLFQLLLNVLKEADKQFTDRKLAANTVTLADLTRYLRKLLEEQVPLARLKNKFSYLFVDEFQDTDNAQIEFIGEVAIQAQIPLLVVGDIKQSIYRFRGANATAFEELKKRLQEKNRQVQEVELRYNYRTTEALLSELEATFTNWRKGDWLPNKDLAMLATRKEADFYGKEAFKLFYTSFNENHIRTYYQDLKKLTKPGVTPPTLAILVRRNSEAIKIGEMLEKLKSNERIMSDVQLEGTLFQSVAAKDLLLLLESWISPTDRPTLYAFQETAFCRGTIKQAYVKRIEKKYVVEQQPLGQFPKAWTEALDQLKFNPAMLVLNEFLSKVPYIENLTRNGKQKDETMKYQLNVYKVLMLLYAALEEHTDLLTLYEWLSIQVATNREEDEAELDPAQFDVPIVKVMTVHKSKGLEFHTVLIPYTQNNFIRSAPTVVNGEVDFDSKPFKDSRGRERRQTSIDILVQTTIENAKTKNEIAWLYAHSKSGFSSITKHYDSLKEKEDNEAAKEEARTLYVALTRAEDRCFIFDIGISDRQQITTTPKKWANLLLMEDK